MFPETVTEYLEEQAEELAGKPAALERFITEHLARNSEPPDYWQPKVQSVTTKIEPNCDVIENAGVLNLSREDQGKKFSKLFFSFFGAIFDDFSKFCCTFPSL